MERLIELKNKVNLIESEVSMIKRIIGVRIEKKSPTAWNRLEKLGKQIGKGWRIKQPSWKVISESRR